LVSRALLALTLAACASTAAYTRTPLPCQQQAVDLVWRATYGRSDPPPDIWWVPAAAQTCQEPGRAPGMPGYVMVDGKVQKGCIGSGSWSGGVSLIWYGSWTRTNLAHELAHVAQERDGMPPDWAHQTAPFASGGAVERANASLAAMRCAP
jgi:hypothetical protein